jgi:clan AA aspartic protease
MSGLLERERLNKTPILAFSGFLLYLFNNGRNIVGIVRIELTLKNAGDATNAKRGIINEPEIRQTTVTAMVDTGAATLVINEAVRKQLGVEIESEYVAELADGSDHGYFLTEAVKIHWKNRDTVCQAILVPNASEVLLGAIPLEAMDLIINPLKQELTGAHGDKIVYRI